MKKKSPRPSDSDPSATCETAGGVSRRHYDSPTLDRYGSLMELTRTAPVPPVNDALFSGSGGGT